MMIFDVSMMIFDDNFLVTIFDVIVEVQLVDEYSRLFVVFLGD